MVRDVPESFSMVKSRTFHTRYHWASRKPLEIFLSASKNKNARTPDALSTFKYVLLHGIINSQADFKST
mgnify:CR=1 FL=1